MDSLNFTQNMPESANQYESQQVRMNLEALGFEKAGRNVGDPNALDIGFSSVVNRQIVSDKHDEAKQQVEMKKVEQQIETSKQQLNTAEMTVKDLTTVKMPNYELQISEIKNDISELELEKTKVSEKDSKASFNFWMIFCIFVPTTVFLYCFYVSSFHNAFFRDIAAQVATANASNISSVLNTVFNGNAFSELHLHWFAPVIFFAFAMVLHLMFDSESESKWKYLKIAAIVAFIFFADGLLAYFIEANNHKLEVLMGLDKDDWIYYKSPVFIMILVMGFFTCMGWSVLLHKLREQKENMNPQAVIRKKISLMKKKIREIEAQIASLKSEILKSQAEVEKLRQQIEYLKKDLEMIHYGVNELILSINEFYSGWLRYILNLSDQNKIDRLKQECEKVKNHVIASLTNREAA